MYWAGKDRDEYKDKETIDSNPSLCLALFVIFFLSVSECRLPDQKLKK